MPTPSGATLGDANMADVTFVQLMLPHHEQALEMTKMARDRADDHRVLDLMVQMWDEQAAEIDEMKAMLAGWNVEPAPLHDMPGMVSDADMALMSETGGAAFDEMFLTHMIAHHEGAITMAEDVLANGTDPQVRAMAESIIASQQAEIDQMRSILAEQAG